MLRLVMLFLLIGMPAFAAESDTAVSDKLAGCAAEKADDKRLACFDALTKAVASSQQTATPSKDASSPKEPVTTEIARPDPNHPKYGDSYGSWFVAISKDELTGSQTIELHANARPDAGDNPKASLALFCDGSGINVVFQSAIYLGDWDSKFSNVAFRFDDTPPVSEAWHSRKNHSYPNDAKPFVTALLAAKHRLVVQVRSFDFESHTSVFDIDGLPEGINVLHGCRPPPPSTAPAPAHAPTRATKHS